MQRECAITVITNMEEQRSLGTAHMISFTLQECAKTVILTIITERKEWRSKDKRMNTKG